MNIKNNQRSQHTQNKIKQILIEFLKSKNIHQISVQDICRKADINRTTFYAHYDDIYDLMFKIEQEKEKGIISLFLEPESGMYNIINEKSLEKLINFIYENSDFYRVYLNDFESSKAIDKSIAASWKKYIEPALRKVNDKSEIELRYQFEYFKSGLNGVIKNWLNTNCQESPSKLARLIKSCIYLK
ncbi:MAG: hypothetical protein K0R50_1488 [Eubacterium sp.]|nr:hypothetical protein [Eubacterium sp.]